MELDHLALEEVDALGRVPSLAEDVVLDLLEVVLEPVDDRAVVVHDLVEDRPDGRRGPISSRSGCSSSRSRAGPRTLASPWRTAIT